MIDRAMQSREMFYERFVPKCVVNSKPVYAGSPSPFSALSIASAPKVYKSSLLIKRLEEVCAIESCSPPLDIEIVSTGVEIADDYKRHAFCLARYLDASSEECCFCSTLREVTAENAQGGFNVDQD